MASLWLLIVLSWNAADGLPLSSLDEVFLNNEFIQRAEGNTRSGKWAESDLRKAAAELAALAKKESGELKMDEEDSTLDLGEGMDVAGPIAPPPPQAMADKNKEKFKKNAANSFLPPKKLVETEENVTNARGSFKGPHAEIKVAIMKKDKLVNAKVFGKQSERQVKVASIKAQEEKLAKSKARLAAQKPRVFPEIHPAAKSKQVVFGSNTTRPTPAPTPVPTPNKVAIAKAAKEKKAAEKKAADKAAAKKKAAAKLKANAKRIAAKAAKKPAAKRAPKAEVMLGESDDVAASERFKGGETMSQEDSQEEELVEMDRNKSPKQLVEDIDKLRSEASEARMKSRTAYMMHYIKTADEKPKDQAAKLKQQYMKQTFLQEMQKHPEYAGKMAQEISKAVDQRKHPWAKQDLGDSKGLHDPQIPAGQTVAGVNHATKVTAKAKEHLKEAQLKKEMDAAAAAGNYVKAGKLQAELQADQSRKAKKKAPETKVSTKKVAPKAKGPVKKAAPKVNAPAKKAEPKAKGPEKKVTVASKKATSKKEIQPPLQSDVSIQAQRPPASAVAAAMAEYGPGGVYCKDCS